MRISQLPGGERPRERCQRLGVGALSAVELLALVLGGGSGAHDGLALAYGLLERFADLRELGRADPAEILRQPGLGQAKSAALAAAFELGRRSTVATPSPWQVVDSPQAAAEVVRPLLADLTQEAIAVLLLGARHQILRLNIVAVGGLNAAAVQPREVFRGAIGAGAAALVLAHNHPSGSAEPSEDDVRLTKRMAACGKTLGVAVLDHIVLGHDSYVSLRERDLF